MKRFSRSARQQISERANLRCEYCQLPAEFSFQTFQIDHIVAIKHGGSDELINLAWACADCNNAKGSDQGSYDTETGNFVLFFNPRTQTWEEHFEIEKGFISGKTATGRVTVQLLQMNRVDQIETRRLLIENSLWD